MRILTHDGENEVPHEPKSHLASNIVYLYILQGLNYAIPLAVLPYLVRVLGMDVYGLVAFSQAFAQYFIVFTDYGFNLSATRTIAQYHGNLRAIRKTFFQVFLFKSAFTLLGIVLLWCIALAVPRVRHDLAYFLLAYLSVIGNLLFPQWYFQGIEKMQYISIYTGIAKLSSAALLFAFVHSSSHGLRAIGILSIGTLISGILGTATALREIGLAFERPSWQELRATLSDGWHVFVATASISLYTNTNVFVVGLLAGNVQVGYFSAAEKLIRAMTGVAGPVTQAVYPRINSLAAASRDAALSLASKVLFWMSGTSLLMSLAMMFLANTVTAILFGANAAGTVPVIRWIAFLPFLIAISNVLGIQTMLTFGLDRQFSRILLISGIVNVAVAIPLVHSLGAMGAGIAVFLTETLVTVTMAVVLWRHDIRIPFLRSAEA